jgi:serine/threonine-protein kinase
MTLATNTRLGPYEIIAPIGAGGMGEVYCARDTRLGRDVAIKVLPCSFSADPDRLHRFEREARAAAALNHPNILSVFQMGTYEGAPYLVSELLEGQTLREHIRRGPLTVRTAINYAVQIANGLAAAHDKGIVHRDLKPENLFVAKDGRVKILDFGLAKLTQPKPDTTATTRPLAEETKPGLLIGTVGYMSPEQIRGGTADSRSDIFAFGAILYEMLSGKRAFQGQTPADVIGAILKDELPSLSDIVPAIPLALRSVIHRCVEKNPEQRFHSVWDLALALEALSAASDSATALPHASGEKVKTPPSWLWIAAAIAIGVIAVGILVPVWTPRPSQTTSVPATTKRFVIHLPPSDQIAFAHSVPYGIGRPSIALSPEGRHLAYVVEHENQRQLYLRNMDQFEGSPLPQTEGAFLPFFSPDGQWIGFFTDTQLKKIFVGGGGPVVLCDARNVFGACWTSDNVIYFSQDDGHSLFQVSGDGGTPKGVADGPFTIYTDNHFFFPHVLPGTDSLLVNRIVFFHGGTISLYSLKTGKQRVLIQGGTDAQYVPTGHLLYARQGELVATEFDLNRQEVSGAPVPVLEGVRTEAYGSGQYSFSHDGTLAYVPGGTGLDGKLAWVDRSGKIEPLPTQARTYGDFRLSPDAQHLAATIYGTTVDIWVYDFNRNAWTRLTSDGINTNPMWTPDGKHIVYAASVNGSSSNLFWQPSDASTRPQRLTSSEYIQTPSSWSPDGKTLLFRETNPKTGGDIWALQLDGEKSEVVPYLQTSVNESFPTFSRDGRWVAYASTESGRFEVYLSPYPAATSRLQISTEGGEEPIWSPQGNELFYRNGQKWMKVAIKLGSKVVVGKPEALFEGPFVNVPGYSYDVGPGARKFLVLLEAGAGSASEIRIVLNWFDELKSRMSKTR